MMKIWIRDRLLGAFDNFNQSPALVLAHRTDFHDADGIALTGIVVFIVCHQLRRLLNELAVHRMLHPTLDGNRNALVHLAADNKTDSFLTCVSAVVCFHCHRGLGEPFTVSSPTTFKVFIRRLLPA